MWCTLIMELFRTINWWYIGYGIFIVNITTRNPTVLFFRSATEKIESEFTTYNAIEE